LVAIYTLSLRASVLIGLERGDSDDGWSCDVMARQEDDAQPARGVPQPAGDAGLGLLTSVTTVKTIVNVAGNDLVFVFKKAGAGGSPRR
jgi:hypothetical protein